MSLPVAPWIECPTRYLGSHVFINAETRFFPFPHTLDIMNISSVSLKWFIARLWLTNSWILIYQVQYSENNGPAVKHSDCLILMIVLPSCLSHSIALVLSADSIQNVHILVLYGVNNNVTFILISVKAERDIKRLQNSYLEEHWLLVRSLVESSACTWTLFVWNAHYISQWFSVSKLVKFEKCDAKLNSVTVLCFEC